MKTPFISAPFFYQKINREEINEDAMNEPKQAVYRLDGYILQSVKNGEIVTGGQEYVWHYVDADGNHTGLGSEESAEDLQLLILSSRGK
jgi:hypothetical protein